MSGFGIVGTGVIAALHAAAIRTLPGARLAAVTDVVAGAAGAFAAARGCAAEPDLDALLARPDVDVVCVCVPSGLHAEIGIRAARAGKHLVVEKPVDVTLAAADRLIEAARTAGVALTVISQHRFDPGLIELKRLIDEGALGRLVLGEASTKWYRTQGYYDSAAWRGTWAMDGGSLMNQGVHYVDLLRWCMGPVTEVTAVCATQAHQVEVEDTALALVRFGSGAVGTDLVHHRRLSRLPAAARDHRDRRHGDRRGRPYRPPCARPVRPQPVQASPVQASPVQASPVPTGRVRPRTRPRSRWPATRRSSPTCWPRWRRAASPPSAARPAATLSRSSAPCTSRPAPAAPSGSRPHDASR